VVGTGKKAQYLEDLFSQEDRCLARLHFLSEDHLGGRPSTDVVANPVAAMAEDRSVEELERELQIDQVVIAVDDTKGLHFDALLPWKTEGIPVFDFTSFLERETGRVNLTWTDSDWLLYSEGFKFGLLDLALKRLLDIVVSVAFLLLTMPTFVLVALAVLLEDFGPVFYSQERVTQNGRSFWILKFRTMRVDAEKFGAQWASERDPRITRVGHFLRRTRIDEIPQLINVLRGDMSLVGPRPERPVFVEKLSEEIRLYKLRHSMKAGVTGWAQINYPYGASVADARNKLEFDLFYLKHFSVLRDVSIMLQTFRVLAFAQGSR
jgi:exopolysaccharide biosynthesis polyprenyl glycosylphosphotransferase